MEEKMLEEIFMKREESILSVLYDDFQNKGKILTKEFKRNSDVFQNIVNKHENELMKQIELVCDGKEDVRRKLEAVFEEYQKNVERKNCFYAEQTYKQRNK